MPIFGTNMIGNIFNSGTAFSTSQTGISSVWVTGNVTSASTTSSFIGSGGAGGTCFLNTAGNNIASVYAATICEIDEAEYMQHAEYYDLARQRGIAFRIRTAEETRIKNESLERARIERERRNQELKIARERSRELLLEHLSEQQRETFEKNKWFVVIGGKTKKEYRIRTDFGVAGNIEVIEKGKRVATLCCHCRHDIPESDHFLAQKIALQWDEDKFLRTANRRAA